MKRKTGFIFLLIVYFVLWTAAVWFTGIKLIQNSGQKRAVFMNRMTNWIAVNENTDISEVALDFNKSDVTSDISVYYLDNEKSFSNNKDFFNQSGNYKNTYIWEMSDEEGNLIGFAKYRFDNTQVISLLILAEISSLAFLIPFVLLVIYIQRNILKPFSEFSEYPNKLAKGITTDSIPESKNRLFGKYVWGMNMLNSKLESDRKQIDRLMYDRKQFVSTIAHGIKTPVANIKLYSEAIETGLYRDGVPDEKDSEIANKIGKNADDIAKLVGNFLNDPGSLQSNYEPDISNFYLEDVKKRIVDDFDNRLRMKDIPFDVEISGNPMVSSDFEAIIRCLNQLMENAIKYGDGTGIVLKLYRQDDMFFFDVINRGVTINSEEVPLVFNCYFRGSNAAGKEGSGIGLYEAKAVAKSLGGDILMKTDAETTEVILYIPG